MKHLSIIFKGFTAGLLALLVLAGCSDLLMPAPETTTEPGMGRLTISLTGTHQGERTLFPSRPGSFSKYELAFTPESGQEGIPAVTLTNGLSHSLILPTGNWTITALAYIQIQGVVGISNGDYVAARGSETVTVSSDSPANISIDLHGGVDGKGRGVFSYDITIPEDLTLAALEILSLEGGSPVKSVNLKSAPSGSFALGSGYYLLKISREKGGESTVRVEVVHIYEGWTTEAVGQGYDFTGLSSVAEILEFLSVQPANTVSSPYPLVLSGVDLRKDFYKGNDSLGLLYEALDGKYVDLDLSACGGNIPDTFYDVAYSRPDQDKIVSLTLPDTLTSIGAWAFYGCSSLATIDLPDTLTSIRDYAFSGCTSLATIDLLDGLTFIGQKAFSGCSSLATIDLPDSLTSIEWDVFSGCSSLASIALPVTLTEIGGYAFYGCTSLVSIDLPDTLTSIKQGAFSGCSSLATIDLPDTLTSIVEAGTFRNCSSLATIDLPDALTEIGESAFSDCTSLAAIDLPDGLTSVGSGAFSGCTSLVSIVLPVGLASIGSSAFSRCTSLAAIVLPNGLTSIDRAFSGCTSLVSIVLPATLASIGTRTFSDCTSLTSIDLPDSLTSIGNEAFYGCTSLATIDLPDSLTSIGDSAFSGCTALASIDLPDTLTEIGEFAFYRCTSLTSIDLPDSLTSIGNSAFSYCTSLTSIDLPNTLTSIEQNAFSDCTSLATVISRNITPPSLGSNVFLNPPAGPFIYVPNTSVAAYKSAWSVYADKIKPLSQLP